IGLQTEGLLKLGGTSQHTSPTLQESMRGGISPPSTTQATTTAQLRQQQPELHMQHQHQALEQQRQWQLQQELSLQQERGRLAAQEKTREEQRDKKQSTTLSDSTPTGHSQNLRPMSAPAHPGHA
ncbi:hypothetical protein, partial [Xanthomonas oryzae]